MDTVRFATGTPRSATGTTSVAVRERPVVPARSAEVTTASMAAAGVDATVERRSQPATEAVAAERPPALDLRALLDEIGRHIDPERRSLSFEVHEELGRAIVSVYDAETEELVRQIPADEMIRIAAVMREIAEQGEPRAASGLLLDARA
ncbi:MAG: hypothetical protein CALGDGBN_01174 [Pseudomonadales bacterium]|nr:hypothetical protein [Pseudomonadales bacterium]